MALKAPLPEASDAHRAAAELDRSIAAFIARPDATDAEFDQLSLALFAYQYRNNAPYRKLCDQQRRTPENVDTWRDVPALSAASFADARIACFPPERTRLTFVSSGTTRAGAQPSTHELENADLYDASLLTQFKRLVLPDRERIKMVLLSPSFAQAPRSSLAYMLEKVYAAAGAGGGFLIHDDALAADDAAVMLNDTGEPVLVFGTAFAFVHLLDYCADRGLRFSLPPGSRIVETGGFKGKSRLLEREELYQALVRTFGVPEAWCISEYGMCELGSQWYDASLSDAIAGRAPRAQLKLGPHWARARAVDPITARELPKGSTGLLQVFDLSNRGSVAAVLTGDLVTETDEGFIYMGRSQAAPPKGCSITVDSMLRRHA
jgi:hypothetical protein